MFFLSFVVDLTFDIKTNELSLSGQLFSFGFNSQIAALPRTWLRFSSSDQFAQIAVNEHAPSV
jgi:hypothetical protein